MSKTKDVTVSYITVDKPTVNGNIYSKECLENMVSQLKHKGFVPVVNQVSDGLCKLANTVGQARNFYLDPDGQIQCTVEIYDSRIENLLQYIDIVPVMTGNIGEGNKVDPDSIKIRGFSIELKGPR